MERPFSHSVLKCLQEHKLKWSEIEGSFSGEIHVYRRPDESGTYEFLRNRIAPGQELQGEVIESSIQLSNTVSQDVNAIGFVGSPFIGNAKALEYADNTQTLSSKPDESDIRSREYALSRPLYLYTSNNPISDTTEKFISFIKSDIGQEIVASTGFVPLFSRSETAESNEQVQRVSSLPDHEKIREYIQAISDKKRFERNFQFALGSCVPDATADEIITRLTGEIQPAQVVTVIGHTDDVGDDNNTFAQCRANKIAELLSSAGIPVGRTVWTGKYMPLASNDTEDGKARNRRVEIWIGGGS